MSIQQPNTPPGKGGLLLVSFLAGILPVIRSFFLLFILLFFVAQGLAKFKDVEKFAVFSKIIVFQSKLEKPMLASLKNNIPTNFNGSDVSRWILFGGAYLISVLIGDAAEAASGKKSKLKKQRAAMIEATTPELRQQHQALKAGKLARNELLEIYAEAKKSLETQKQNLAFLSIDIVDSTGMKVGEDAGIAERDFRQYKFMVERVIEENKALKSTWTPDGVMICFSSVVDAVRAGQGVIKGLGLFNQRVKTIKKDFAIRAGINAGLVFCDDATPMEEMTDRVIDIAGHMQKHGTINAVCISKHAIEPYLDKFNFVSEDRVVDGCPVYQWKESA